MLLLLVQSRPLRRDLIPDLLLLACAELLISFQLVLELVDFLLGLKLIFLRVSKLSPALFAGRSR